MLSLDPGRGCNVFTVQLALALTGCSGDIGLPLELRLCFEPCVQCAGQFIGRKTRFDVCVLQGVPHRHPAVVHSRQDMHALPGACRVSPCHTLCLL